MNTDSGKPQSYLDAAAVHDLKSPLTVIKGFVKILLEGKNGPLTPEQIENLGFIEESACKLQQMIETLAELSHSGSRECGKISK